MLLLLMLMMKRLCVFPLLPTVLFLSSAFLHTVASTNCPVSTGTPASQCCANLNVRNISNTAYLLEWTDSPNGSEHTIQYQEVQSNTDMVIPIGPNNTVSVAGATADVLVYLNSSACYHIRVFNNDLCCEFVFTTSNQVVTNQVDDVRVLKYDPLIDPNTNISAQVVWSALDMSVNLASYNVLIRTADRNLQNVVGNELFSIPKQDTFTNVVTRNDVNEFMYPLERSRSYIVQVRGRSETSNFSWSEPVQLNTFGESQKSNLYGVDIDKGGHLFIVHVDTSDYTVVEPVNDRIRASPFTLDKINRSIFYFSEQDSAIMMGDLDSPFSNEELIEVESNQDVRSMAFDWISQRLYIALIDETNTNTQIFYLFVRESSSGLKLIHTVENTIVHEMIVNPFTGFLFWTSTLASGTVAGQYSLTKFSLVSNVREDVLSSAINSNVDMLPVHPTITENVDRNCIYFIAKGDELMGINSRGSSTNELCTNTSAILESSESSYSIASDAGGIHVASNETLVYYDYQGNLLSSSPILQDGSGIVLSALDTTSPGTQPLPPQVCLSPDISMSGITSKIKARTSSILYVEWVEPPTVTKQECQGIVSSSPPLRYNVQAVNNGNLVLETTQYEPYINITTLNLRLGYTITVSAGTAFTIGNLSLLTRLTIDALDSPITSTSPQPSNSSSSNGILDNTLYLVLIVVGGVAVLFAFCVTLCCCFVCCILRKREMAQKIHSKMHMPRRYRRKTEKPQVVAEKVEESVAISDEEIQPVYVLPGGDTPIYDIGSNEQTNSNGKTGTLPYDYPGVISSSAPTTTANNDSSYVYTLCPHVGSVGAAKVSHLSTSTAESENYENPLLLPSQSADNGRIPSAKEKEVKNKNRLSIVSLGKVKRVSKLYESMSIEEKVKKFGKKKLDSKSEEEEDEYVYEFFARDQGKGMSSSASDSNLLNSRRKLSGESEDENIYETFTRSTDIDDIFNDSPAVAGNRSSSDSLQPCQVSPATKGFNAGLTGKTPVTSITQMPLPSIPMSTDSNQDKNKESKNAASTEKHKSLVVVIDGSDHENDKSLIDSQGYLTLRTDDDKNIEDGYDTFQMKNLSLTDTNHKINREDLYEIPT